MYDPEPLLGDVWLLKSIKEKTLLSKIIFLCLDVMEKDKEKKNYLPYIKARKI